MLFWFLSLFPGSLYLWITTMTKRASSLRRISRRLPRAFLSHSVLQTRTSEYQIWIQIAAISRLCPSTHKTIFNITASQCQMKSFQLLCNLLHSNDLLSFYWPCCSTQRRTHQQRRDHGVFHAGKCHLFQTWPRLLAQLPRNHVHETYLLWQLLRICKSQWQTWLRCYLVSSSAESDWNADIFSPSFCCSCGASSNKATDAEVFY